jgi:serine/threonine protein kinase
MHDFIDIMDIIDMALQIFRTLTIVHSMSIIYGDIKPGNIMINLKDNHLTFIDYGGCRLMKCNKLCIFKSENELMEYDNHPGTVPYMSPEAIENNTKDYPSDVWAATLVVLELICCQTFMPKYITLITHYKNIEDRIKVIRSGKFNTLANPELMACLFNIASSIEQLDLSLVITELFAEIYKHSEYDKKIIDELKEAIIGGLLIDDKRRYTALEIYEKIQKIYKKIDIKSDYLKN